MSLLKVTNLQKSFGNIEVLKGIDLSLEAGEVLSVIGSSGGGKTTLLRCLNFLEMADTGTIEVDGEVVYAAEGGKRTVMTQNAQALFGLVFQQFNLFPQYTVLENLTLAPRLRAKREKRGRAAYNEIQAKAEQILATVGLTDKANAYPCQLSGGQQQRVAIARAMVPGPQILFFDEPTSALDPELTTEVLRVIKNLKSLGCTMVIVTHEMEFAKNVSDRVIYISDGVIEAEGTPEEVFEQSENENLRRFLQSGKEI